MIESPPQVGVVYATRMERTLFGISAHEDVISVVTGMRKSLARAEVERLLQAHGSITDVINVGFAGSLKKDTFPLGRVVFARSVQDQDDDTERAVELTDSLNILRDVDARTARILTGDQIITGKTNPSKLHQLQRDGDVVDMEASAIVRVCMERGVTPHILKMVSDEVSAGRSRISQALGMLRAVRATGKMEPMLEEILEAIRRYRGNERV